MAGQANALINRGKIRRRTEDPAGACEDLSQALALYQRLGNRLGQARTLALLAQTRQATGDDIGAADAHARALTLYQELGDQPTLTNAIDDAQHAPSVTRQDDKARPLDPPSGPGERLDQAGALIGLGRMRMLDEDYPGALEAHARALDIYRDVGSYDNEAWAMNLYARIFAAAGDVAQALAVYRDALRLTREVQHHDDEAIALEGIGECLMRTAGSARQGTEYLNQALDAYRRLGMRPDIKRVQARLDTLTTP